MPAFLHGWGWEDAELTIGQLHQRFGGAMGRFELEYGWPTTESSLEAGDSECGVGQQSGVASVSEGPPYARDHLNHVLEPVGGGPSALYNHHHHHHHPVATTQLYVPYDVDGYQVHHHGMVLGDDAGGSEHGRLVRLQATSSAAATGPYHDLLSVANHQLPPPVYHAAQAVGVGQESATGMYMAHSGSFDHVRTACLAPSCQAPRTAAASMPHPAACTTEWLFRSPLFFSLPPCLPSVLLAYTLRLHGV